MFGLNQCTDQGYAWTLQTVTVNKWQIPASRTQQVPVKYLHSVSSLPETPIRDTAEG